MSLKIHSFLLILTALLQIVPLALGDAERESLDRRAHRAALQSSSHEPDASVGPDDLVVVFGTTNSGHHPELVKATRFWRKGLAAFIATNEPMTESQERVGQVNNELYVTYPDSTDRRTQYPGDTRAALAPLLAHRALQGQYKWMLYGDDDTIWFVNGVLDLARKLDPTMPYIITDAGYWHNWNKPGWHDRFQEDGRLQCLPCNFNIAEWHGEPGAAFTPPIACPCTAQLLCETDKRGILPPDCRLPEWFHMIHHMDGGAGALLSHGLLDALNASAFEDCVTSGDGIASDYLFSRCMWLSGFAPTFPSFDRMPKGIEKRHTLFNPGGLLDLHHNPDRRAVVTDLLSAVEQREGDCNGLCADRLLSMVSLHLKSQRTANMPSSIFLLRSISSLYDSFLAASNRMQLAEWPLVHAHQYKKPSLGWNSTNVPAMKATRHKYDFGLLNDPHKDEPAQEQRRMHA